MKYFKYVHFRIYIVHEQDMFIYLFAFVCHIQYIGQTISSSTLYDSNTMSTSDATTRSKTMFIHVITFISKVMSLLTSLSVVGPFPSDDFLIAYHMLYLILFAKLQMSKPFQDLILPNINPD